MNKTVSKYLIFILAALAIAADFFEFPYLFYAFKPLTTTLIILYLFRFRTPHNKHYSNPLLFGLIFCLVGDSFLLFPDFFVLGLSSFLIGHLGFIRAFVKLNGWNFSFKTGVPLILIGVTLLWLTYTNLEEMLLPVIIYMTVIILMSWQGMGFYNNLTQIAFKRIGIAVSLFLLSDSLIALNKFYLPFSYSEVIILSTYWLALFLIADSATHKEEP